ncbi:hypothetical protein Tco_1305417 [Tanacetum coccineum]
MAIHIVLPEIALKAATVVAPHTAALDVAIECDPEAEPSEVPPSPDYEPSSPIHAPASPNYHPGSDIESDLFKDEYKPIEDAPEASEPLFAQDDSSSPASFATRL